MNDHPPAAWVPVTAVILAEGRWKTYPGHSFARVLFTFDPRHRHDLVFLDRVCARLARLRGRAPADEDERDMADILARDHVPHRFPRWELPPTLGGGAAVYLAEMLLPFRLLPHDFDALGQLDRFLPCRAEMCAGGRLELLPYRRADVERRALQWLRCLRPRGVQVTGALVQANEALLRPGPRDLPCMVLITFEDFPDQERYLRRLAERVYALKGLDLDDPDARYVSNLVTDERAMKYRRRPLPPSFTGGRVVYAADLIIHRPFLRRGYLVERLLPCLAEPGDEGFLDLLPSGGLAELDAEPDDVPVVDVVQPGAGPVVLPPRTDPRPVPAPRRPRSEEDWPRRNRGAPADAPPRGSTAAWVIGGVAGGLLLLGVVAAILVVALVGRRPVVLSNARTERGLGMQVTFRVDYRFEDAGPQPGVRYFWVMQPMHGGMRREFPLTLWQMQRQGTLAQTVLQVFGEGGPYEAYLESETPQGGRTSRTRVSNTVTFP
jgi:hypothetical protein